LKHFSNHFWFGEEENSFWGKSFLQMSGLLSKLLNFPVNLRPRYSVFLYRVTSTIRSSQLRASVCLWCSLWQTICDALRKVIIFNVLYIWTGPIQNDKCMALGPNSGMFQFGGDTLNLFGCYRNLVFAQLGEVKSPLVKYSCKYSLVVASCWTHTFSSIIFQKW